MTISRVGIFPSRRSVTWIRCIPYSVSTGSEMSPFFRAKAAAANGSVNFPLRGNHFRSPPEGCSFIVGSSEYLLAASAKVILPATMSFLMAASLSLAACFSAAGASSSTLIWMCPARTIVLLKTSGFAFMYSFNTGSVAAASM